MRVQISPPTTDKKILTAKTSLYIAGKSFEIVESQSRCLLYSSPWRGTYVLRQRGVCVCPHRRGGGGKKRRGEEEVSYFQTPASPKKNEDEKEGEEKERVCVSLVSSSPHKV